MVGFYHTLAMYKTLPAILGEALGLNKKLGDLLDLEEYCELVSKRRETEFQKIELDIIDRALFNLKNGYLKGKQ